MCHLKSSYSRVVESTKRENRFKNILVNVPGLKQYFSVCYIKLLMGCLTFFHYVQIVWVIWRMPCFVYSCLAWWLVSIGLDRAASTFPCRGTHCIGCMVSVTLLAYSGLQCLVLLHMLMEGNSFSNNENICPMKWWYGHKAYVIISMETIDNQYFYSYYLYFNYVSAYKCSRCHVFSHD